MRKVWGFSYMTFGTILDNTGCNAGKAGIARLISRKFTQRIDKTRMKKCYYQFNDKL